MYSATELLVSLVSRSVANDNVVSEWCRIMGIQHGLVGNKGYIHCINTWKDGQSVAPWQLGEWGTGQCCKMTVKAEILHSYSLVLVVGQSSAAELHCSDEGIIIGGDRTDGGCSKGQIGRPTGLSRTRLLLLFSDHILSKPLLKGDNVICLILSTSSRQDRGGPSCFTHEKRVKPLCPCQTADLVQRSIISIVKGNLEA